MTHGRNETNPETGDLAPDFTLKTNGVARLPSAPARENRSSSIFIPRTTPRLHHRSCGLQRPVYRVSKLGALIIGVSPDSVQKHDNFIAKHDLSILLASDPDTAVCEAYGVWVEKSMYGKTYMGVERKHIPDRRHRQDRQQLAEGEGQESCSRRSRSHERPGRLRAA